MNTNFFVGPNWVPPPDNLTIPQVFLDGTFRHAAVPVETPDIPCMIEEMTGRKIFITELRARTQNLARALKEIWNIGDDDNVLMFCPNHTDYPVCIWAAHKLGASVTTTSPALTLEEFVHQLQIAKPSLIIADPLVLALARKAALSISLPHTRIVAIGPSTLDVVTIDDLIKSGQSLPSFEERMLAPGEAKSKIAFLCFSSGTTGKPKAVAISHHNVVCNAVQVATFKCVNDAYAPWDERQLKPGDICCSGTFANFLSGPKINNICASVLPFYHIYGLVINMHFILLSKITLVVSQGFDFARLLNSISRYRITTLMLVPPQVVLFCKHPLAKDADLSSVHYCMIAGAPVTAELTKQLRDRLPDVALGQAYGMTETSPGVTMWPVSQRVGTLGSVGRLIAGTIAKVVKEDGTLAKVDEPGELYVRGKQNALGYYKNEAATREVFIDGWVRTGDHVVFRPNGDLFVIDRIKEIIKVKGFQVAPAELEGHLLSHPKIADAAVIGIPDEYAGEVPLAFVVLHPETHDQVKNSDQAAADIRAHIFKHISSVLSQYKWPVGGIKFVEVLPKNQSGKILRRVLRGQYLPVLGC
ncbi:phenylacetyl-CoA ligase [Collybia nuda]|uniref:Phenylacetyl-CoA ligase n=1 Tax=Collybia nuda TaxID=64659 RepID=A0A9P6CHF2_9AGAR|nr:phenylacetyl-CoA ligase [Collybia nuda]